MLLGLETRGSQNRLPLSALLNLGSHPWGPIAGAIPGN
jgi:hypothetical protein